MTEAQAFNLFFLIWGVLWIAPINEAAKSNEKTYARPISDIVYFIAFLFTWAVAMTPVWIWGLSILYRNP